MKANQELEGAVKVANACIIIDFKWMDISNVIAIEMDRFVELVL
jgi:hypothetical protein